MASEPGYRIRYPQEGVTGEQHSVRPSGFVCSVLNINSMLLCPAEYLEHASRVRDYGNHYQLV